MPARDVGVHGAGYRAAPRPCSRTAARRGCAACDDRAATLYWTAVRPMLVEGLNVAPYCLRLDVFFVAVLAAGLCARRELASFSAASIAARAFSDAKGSPAEKAAEAARTLGISLGPARLSVKGAQLFALEGPARGVVGKVVRAARRIGRGAKGATIGGFALLRKVAVAFVDGLGTTMFSAVTDRCALLLGTLAPPLPGWASGAAPLLAAQAQHAVAFLCVLAAAKLVVELLRLLGRTTCAAAEAFAVGRALRRAAESALENLQRRHAEDAQLQAAVPAAFAAWCVAQLGVELRHVEQELPGADAGEPVDSRLVSAFASRAGACFEQLQRCTSARAAAGALSDFAAVFFCTVYADVRRGASPLSWGWSLWSYAVLVYRVAYLGLGAWGRALRQSAAEAAEAVSDVGAAVTALARAPLEEAAVARLLEAAHAERLEAAGERGDLLVAAFEANDRLVTDFVEALALEGLRKRGGVTGATPRLAELRRRYEALARNGAHEQLQEAQRELEAYVDAELLSVERAGVRRRLSRLVAGDKAVPTMKHAAAATSALAALQNSERLQEKR